MIGTKSVAVATAQNTPSMIQRTPSNPASYAKYTSALVTADSVAPTFMSDASPAGTVPKAVTDPRADSFNPFAGSYYSNYFNGSSYLTMGTGVSQFTIGTNNFTIEGWVYLTAAATSRVFMAGQSNLANASGSSFVCYVGTGASGTSDVYVGSSTYSVTSPVVPLNQWAHVAWVRNGTSWTSYLNGAQVGTATLPANAVINTGATTYANAIGAFANAGGALTGYISNLRFVNGTAVYTGAFTPATSPLTAVANTALLTCQGARMIDYSSYGLIPTLGGAPVVSPAIPFTAPSSTNGSAYFNPNNRLSMVNWAYNQNFNLGTTWTMECWIFPTVGGASSRIMGMEGNVVANFAQFFLSINASNQLVMTNRPTTGGAVSSITGTISLIRMNEWTHVAVANNAGVCKIFINGVLNGTNNAFPAFGDPTLYVGFGGSANGSYQSGVDWFPGYISNVKIVKGAALYTATFTPPTSPLTADANTVLLTAQYNAHSRNNSFNDSSGLDVPMGSLGGGFQVTQFSPFMPSQYSSSVYFNGSTDYISAPSNAAFTFGTGDFTVEAWVNSTAAFAASTRMLSQNTGGMNVFPNASGNMIYSAYGGGVLITSTTACVLNTWYHVAVTRVSGTTRLFINGNLEGTFNSDTNNYTSTSFLIGTDNGTNKWTGYMSNVRVIKGSGIYTAAFTPSTTPLTAVANTSLLACQSVYFADKSTNNFALTLTGTPAILPINPFSPYPVNSGSSAYISAAYAGATLSSTYSLPGDFTLEFWAYPTNVTAAQCSLFGLGQTATPNNGFDVYFDTNGSINMFSNSAMVSTGAAGVIKNNQWHHIAVVRIGTSLKIYVNGASAGVATNSTAFVGTATAPLTIGGAYTSAGTWQATGTFYMTNVRLVNGTGVYTTTFTPPTAPVTSIAKTVLLLNFDNGGAVDNTGYNQVFLNGTAQAVSNNKKYGSGALYFDATATGYAYIPDNAVTPAPSLRFAKDFTVECWVMRTSGTATRAIAGKGASNTGWFFGIDVSGKFVVADTASATLGTLIVSDNVWYHVALVRIGTALKFYVNGVQEISLTSSTVFNQVANLYIGANRTAANNFAGYIDDFRVTNGVGRYTGNFVVPQRGFTIYD